MLFTIGSAREKILLCVVVLVWILEANAQWAIEDDGCRTPDRGTGTCVPVRECIPIINFLNAASKPLTQKVVQTLQSYQCGFEGTSPKVCCPPGPIPNGNGGGGGGGDNSQDTPPDVSRHRNINLLPSNCGVVDTGDRIINGNKTGLFEFPWMALISYQTQRGPDFSCGATILNERYVLTAAHCITNLKSTRRLLGVRVGDHDINTNPDCEIQKNMTVCAPPYQDLAIEEVIPHPRYNATLFSNDIGLLRVARIDLTRVNAKPVCMPLSKMRNYNFAGKRVIVTGWGATETGRNSPDLLKVTLPTVPMEECRRIYVSAAPITNRQICAGGVDKKDSCPGDSGGPLHVVGNLNGDARYVQQGIVSFGPRICGNDGLPGVYTRTAFYLDWILDNLRP